MITKDKTANHSSCIYIYILSIYLATFFKNVGVGVLDDPKQMKEKIGTRTNRSNSPHHNSNGITLVALVVTIVIMLILAGITLTVAFGENGLVTRARRAKDEARGEIVYNEVIKWKENIELVQGAGGERDKPYEEYLEEILQELLDNDYITEKERQEIRDNPEHKITVGKREIDFRFESLKEPENAITIVAGDIEFTQTPNTLTNESIIVTMRTNIQGYIIEYSKDNEEWSTYTNGVEYLQNGTLYARLKKENKASNVLTEEIINIDKVLPIITSSSSTTKSVTFSGTDNNGIIGYNVTTSSTPPSGWATITSTKTLIQTVNNLTQNTSYYIWVKDVAGNVNTVQSIVTEALPTLEGNITFSYSPSTWTNQNVTATVSTGITGYTLQVSKDGTTWTNYTSGIEYSQNGTVYAKLTDGVNETDVATGSVSNIDKTPPSCWFAEEYAYRGYEFARLTDSGSGVCAYHFRIGQTDLTYPTTWTSISPTLSTSVYPATSFPDDTYIIIFAMDQAGNMRYHGNISYGDPSTLSFNLAASAAFDDELALR